MRTRLAILAAGLLCLAPRASAGADAPRVGEIIQDCPHCPQLVVTPPGDVMLGSPDAEPDRNADEGPIHRVVIPKPLAVGRFEVTRDQYEAFLRATGRAAGLGCTTGRATHGVWAPDPQGSLHAPGFAQAGDHPVVCVSWDEAQAYVDWLNTQAPGRRYRLPTEAEWEYLARAGTTGAYPWGADPAQGCPFANGADLRAKAEYPDWDAAACDDGALNTAPVGAYRPNAFGLYDMIGNTGEWTQDCHSASYAPGAARDCTRRMVRGGSWGSLPKWYRVADRLRYPAGMLDDSVGIRVVRDLE